MAPARTRVRDRGGRRRVPAPALAALLCGSLGLVASGAAAATPAGTGATTPVATPAGTGAATGAARLGTEVPALPGAAATHVRAERPDDQVLPPGPGTAQPRHSSDGVVGPVAKALPPGLRGLAVRTVLQSYEVAPGVSYRRWKETDARGTVRAHLVTVDLDEPGVALDYASRARVRQRGALTDLLGRDGAVAGVNGDFFDINQTGAPIGVGVDRGRGRHAPAQNWNTAFVVERDGTPSIRQARLVASVRGRPGLVVTNVNSPVVRVQGIGMYTSSWGRTAGRSVVRGAPAGSVRQVVVRRGRVVSTSRRLSKGTGVRGRVFVGRGAGARALAGLSRGDRVRLRWQVDGRPRLAISGNLALVSDGVVQVDDDGQLHPRTAVGIDRDTGEVLLLVVDGRQEASRGHTLLELAETMRDLGAEEALNLDGGGSSTLAALTRAGELTVKSSPSSGQQRAVPNGLGVLYAP